MASKITRKRLVLSLLSIAGVLAVLAAALAVSLKADKHSKHTDPSVTRADGLPMPVKLGVVGTREVVESVYASAQIAADSEPSIYSPTSALVKKIYVTDGARVQAGALLVQLDTTDLDREIATDVALADGARQKRDAAKQTLERKEILRAQQLSTETEIEQAKSQLLDAENALTKALAEVDKDQRQLKDYTIRAPSAGIVEDIIDQGWPQVSPSTRLVDFVSTASLSVTATLPEEYLPLLKPDTDVEITVAALPGEKFPGRVANITVAVDPKTRTAPVKIVFTSPDPRFVPGMTAQAHLNFKSNGVAIPLIALSNRIGRQGSVFRVTDHVAGLRSIRLGRMSADWVEVLDGLSVGDVIVTTGQLYLYNGDKVAEVK